MKAGRLPLIIKDQIHIGDVGFLIMKMTQERVLVNNKLNYD
jgi:hypothetical protein